MREDGCSCVLAPNELQLAGYSLCLRPTREPSRSYGNHYYTASFFANPLEVIGPHLEKKTRGIFFLYIQPQLNIQAQHKRSLVELGATLRAPLLESNKGGLFGAISFCCGCS